MDSYALETLSRHHATDVAETAERRRAGRILRARRQRSLRRTLATRLRTLADRVDPRSLSPARPVRLPVPRQST